MTADQIRSLQPALAALLETFRPYLRSGFELRSFAGVRAGSDGGPEAQEHRTDRFGRGRGGADLAGISLISGLGPRGRQRPGVDPVEAYVALAG